MKVDIIKVLTDKIIENPTADLYLQRGNIYLNSGKYELALYDFSEGANLDKKQTKCFVMKLHALAKLKRFDHARKVCKDAKELEEKFFYGGFGSVYWLQGRFEDALINFDKAIAIDPEDACFYIGRGNVYINQKRYEDALKDFCKALEFDQNDAYLFNGRGKTYYYLNYYEQALKDFNKAIEIDPYFATAYNWLGNVYSIHEQYEEALRNYGKAIELEQTMAFSHYNRASLYFKQGNYDAALVDFKAAHEYFVEKDKYHKSIASKKISEIKLLIQDRSEETKDNAEKVIDETNAFLKKIKENEKSRKGFYSFKQHGDVTDSLTFTVLRKWNSFTPIVGGGFSSCKGGGYFIKNGKTGIVIDPGFNFIENFIVQGFKFNEIDAVLITHAHNDHTADLDSILTMLHTYNKDLYGGDLSEFPEEGSILESVLTELDYSLEMIQKNSALMTEVKQKADAIYKKISKKIIFYITSGTLKKYACFFDLSSSSNYKFVTVDSEIVKFFQIGDINIRVVKANHNDIMSDISSVGFCFEQDNFRLIYTGDTGFWGMYDVYEKLKKEYSGKKIVLLANLGGLNYSEMFYRKDDDIEKHYYKQHLGRLGVAKIVEILRPQLCIISEFGEELNGYRIKIANIYNKIYKEYLQTVFLPADIGLCVKRNKDDSSIEVFAMLSDENIEKKDFIRPCDVRVGEVRQNSQLYYYDNKVDAVNLHGNMVAEFYKKISK